MKTKPRQKRSIGASVGGMRPPQTEGPTEEELRRDELADAEMDEKIEMLRREVGHDVRSPISVWLALGILQNRYWHNDRLALLQAVVQCRNLNAHLPSWALHALAGAFEKYLRGDAKSLDEALWGRKRGRHADPLAEFSDKFLRRRAYEAVEVAKLHGLTLEAAVDLATDAMRSLGHAIALETVRQYYLKVRREREDDRAHFFDDNDMPLYAAVAKLWEQNNASATAGAESASDADTTGPLDEHATKSR